MEVWSITYLGLGSGQYITNPYSFTNINIKLNKKKKSMVSVGLRPPRSSRCIAMGIGNSESEAEDDSTPFEMSMDSALKLLGVSEKASFDDILRAKNSILSSSKHDPQAAAQVEAAYDMLLMLRLTQRQAGKVVNKTIPYADVKLKLKTPPSSPSPSPFPFPFPSLSFPPNNWITIEKQLPSSSDLGIQAAVYAALMAFTYINGASSPSSSGSLAAPDVPGFILATSFGASLYFITKNNVNLGKATVITVGGLVAGAIVGSAIENWLQVDIVPFLGLHSPAALVTEFILLSQFLVSLYLR